MFDDRIEFLQTSSLLETELTEPDNALRVIRRILRAGAWTDPIWVERRSQVVMDGHHRLAAARALGIQRVPCIRWDYGEILVTSRRPGVPVSPDEIVSRGCGRAPYPAKTTRHQLRDGLRAPEMSPVPLDELRAGTFERHLDVVWGLGGRTCELDSPDISGLAIRERRMFLENHLLSGR